MIRSRISLYFHSYRRMSSLGILLLMLVFLTVVFCDPQLDRQINFSTYYVRNSNLFSLETTCLLCIPSVRRPLPPCRWDHKLVSDVSAPPDFSSANFLLEIQETIVYVHYTNLWDVYTKFRITRNETCNQIL